MKRLLGVVVLSCGVILVAGPLVLAQDQIRFFNRKTQKEESLRGNITEENPSTVKFKESGKTLVEIPAPDILEIDYQPPKGMSSFDYRQPFNKERRALEARGAKRKQLLLEALEAYKELGTKVGSARFAARYIQYRIVLILSQLAEEDPVQLDTAIGAVKNFKTENGDGWQLVSAVILLVRLQEQKKDSAAALATYEEAADNAATPQEVRNQFALMAVRYLLRQKKHNEALRRAKKVEASLSRDDPQAPRARVYAAACQTALNQLEGVEKQLKQVLQSGAENDVRAMACNTLGDYYRAKKQPDDAFWQYLWVDVYYNQDREEVARALYHLSKLFVEVRKDTVRSKACRDRLCDETQFGGLEYHKQALTERAAAGEN